MKKSIVLIIQTVVFLLTTALASCGSEQTKNSRLPEIQKEIKTMTRERELIERYRHEGQGYDPFLIAPKWQVAQLNYMPQLSLDGITKVDIHFKTDEVFILLKGTAVLIAADKDGDELDFKAQLMKPGVTYNIPLKTWHNIAMTADAEVIIVEDANTHLGDYEFYYFSDEQKKVLDNLIANAIKE